jgi:hypothetical protein
VLTPGVEAVENILLRGVPDVHSLLDELVLVASSTLFVSFAPGVFAPGVVIMEKSRTDSVKELGEVDDCR